MATTYLVTGLDTGQPRLDYTGVLTGHKVGDTFTTTLDPTLEQKLIGAGILAIAPLPAAVTSAGTPDASGKVLTSTAAGSNEGAWLPGGSGGSRRTIKCPFAFDTPGLLTGAALYTPSIGDVLHDAWFEIDTAWDGTTPSGDIGSFAGGATSGWFSIHAPVLMTVPDTAWDIWDRLLLAQHQGGNINQRATLLSLAYLQANATGSPHITDGWVRGVPAKIVTADPIKVCVSQDGSSTGADPGSTQGAGAVYLDISTPAAP